MRALLVAVPAIAALLGLTLSACSGSGSSAVGSAAPTVAQVTALLSRHAAAVRDRSAPKFLADIDTSAAAASFRTAQAAQLRNLATVPLASWTYTVASVATAAAPIAAQRARFGAPVLIVDVTLSYALAGVDPVATGHDLYWTFVARHGHVYLAGDDALAQLGETSYTAPWDFGPVTVARGTDCLVLGHPTDAAQLPALARAVDAAIPVVTGVWGSGWTRTVAVFVPASTAESAALVGTAAADVSATDVSAETVVDADDPVNGPRFGQRIVLPVASLQMLTPAGLRIVLQHELTHVASSAATTPATPRWLIEGFAEYVGNLGSTQSVRTSAAELASQVGHGVLPAALPGDSDFAATGASLARLYEQSWLACRLIAARVGQAGLVAFYRQVGTSADVDPVAAAVRSVLHESLAAFVAQWRTYLNRELG